MDRLFGTDGVRGIANQKLSPELALKLGIAGAYVLTKSAAGTPRVLVAKDGRRSGDMLEAALTAGLCAIGAEVHQCGVIPTPAVAYLVKKYNFDAGVMISASHNPMADNGIKFFNGEGFKLPDQVEAEIESILEFSQEIPRPLGAGVGIVKTCTHALEDYAAFIAQTAPGLRLDGLKLALDCANGATSAIAPMIFEKLGATVYALHHRPTGCNINENCGSTHMEDLMTFVRDNGCDAGLAFDGDGDRMLAVDNHGQLIDGDAILAICGLDLKERGQLAKDTLVATVMSNQGLGVFCREHGITLCRTAVGDRYVLEKMIADNLTLGGEQSGHTIFRQYNTTGDGILAGVQLLAVMARKQKTLAQLAQMMEVFPQVLINAKVPNNRMAELSTNAAIQKVQGEIEAKLTADERVLVRASGTEPVVRVMIEGRDQAQITQWAQALVDVIEAQLGE
ncbi:MAG: phosphoglucosamine mutase [Defluviitaleaceae bacterium]|nr:phosphoglucosamine mutase [Defluviitaleaceae bacterium]